MKQSQSLTDKKNLPSKWQEFANEPVTISRFFDIYGNAFKVYRRDNREMAMSYVLGLFRCEKNHTNMERMNEFDRINDYHRYYHFISESQWDWLEVNRITAINASHLMKRLKSRSGLPTGLIIDETSHLKKGTESVGVAHQYAGQRGEVANCQVAVYGSLCNGSHNVLMSSRLFLPKKWTSEAGRMKKAGVPESHQSYKSRPEQALEIVDEALGNGVAFDWVGGDGVYGHDSDLCRALDERGVFYVLDVHKTEFIYLEEPQFSIPPQKGKTGRTPTRLKPHVAPVTIRDYIAGLSDGDWHKVKIRKTAKGTKHVKVHIVQVWHWDKQGDKANPRTLIITVDEKRKHVKYSFSNGSPQEHTPGEYAWFQCNRHWVERSFDDAKNEIGLSGYQVRNWTAWHHHVALVMVAGLYLATMRADRVSQYPLMSIRDARLMVITQMFGNEQDIQRQYENMKERHRLRQRDIDIYYRKEKEKQKEKVKK